LSILFRNPEIQDNPQHTVVISAPIVVLYLPMFAQWFSLEYILEGIRKPFLERCEGMIFCRFSIASLGVRVAVI
jgi:hypothetical protein